MNRTLRSKLSLAWVFSGLALLLLAVPASAQEDLAAAEPVRFLIESITVEGIDRAAAREIVAKESRVEPGTEVDENQLRQAIYRVRRLPFVIDADFSLQKGSERGRYVLVIRIEMASSIFANLATGAVWESGESGDGNFDWFGSVGARHFVGSRGYAFGSIDRFRNLQLGYTQFHLFGPGSYLTAALGTNLEDEYDGQTLSLSLGKPLTANQALRAGVGYGDSDLYDQRSASLEWLYDTTDDPLLPTQGDSLSLSAGYGTSEFRFRPLDGSVLRSENRDGSVRAAARRYWPLAARHSIFGEVTAGYNSFRSSGGETVFEGSYQTGSTAFGYAWDLIRSEVGEPRNDLRLLTRANLSVTSDALALGFYGRALVFDSGLTYRRPQGSISLTFSYVNILDRRRFVQ